MVIRLVCVRHGESIYNVQGLCNDDPSKPVVLTSKGEAQADNAGKKLSYKNINVIYTSPFPRAKQTAEIINKHTKVDLIESDLLFERRGNFDGRHFTDWKAKCGPDYFHYSPINGESFQDEKARMKKFVEEIKSTNYKTVAIVTHEEPIQALRCVLTGMSDAESYSQPIPNAGIVEFMIE